MSAMHPKLLAALATLAAVAAAAPLSIPAAFDSRGADRQAIDALLRTYTEAVSAKDQARFETLLLDRTIPFSGVPDRVTQADSSKGMRNYEAFRRGVFEGAPFTQRFQDVHVEQDGALASVRLVFVNRSADGEAWGWKTLLLLKVDDRWKIASEFYTGHS